LMIRGKVYVGFWCFLLDVLRGDGSNAPSPVGHVLVDVSPMPLGTNAAHDPIGIPKSLWARRNPLGVTINPYKMTGMNT